MQSGSLNTDQAVKHMHFGGGVSTLFSAEQISSLIKKLGNHFTLRGDCSIEIDPRAMDWPTLFKLRELGFNQVSIRSQYFNTLTQESVNYFQSVEHTLSVIDAARTMAFKSIHINLIYGLPYQTHQDFRDILTPIIERAPDYLSLVNYARLTHRHEAKKDIKGRNFSRDRDKGNQKIFLSSTEMLLKAGYVSIGDKHFSLLDDDRAIAP
ncbi:MAG: hypothetical protein PUP46_10260 [Endozoicomonas sp. (ex Botrylloides leachii)]|nr:hypothetical protein [Endozoicomonas sp. (ex Botrylloides leachii)]